MKRLLVVLLLAGCADMPREDRAQMIVNRLSPHCEALGYVRNTDPWRKCMEKMYALATQEQSRDRPRVCQEMGYSVMCY